MNSIQDGGTVTDLELDFQLGQSQAVEIATSWLGVGSWTLASTLGPLQNTSLGIELHRRVGTLTDETTPAVTSEFTQAETLQDMLLVVGAADTAAAGGAFGAIQQGQPKIDWRAALDEPLLVAANLTLRTVPGVAISGAATWNGVFAKLLYRYVQVSDTELARAFLARQ